MKNSVSIQMVINNFKTYRWILKKESIIVLVLLLVCLVLRVFNFTSASIWTDEGATLFLSHQSFKELWKISVNDVNPPLYGWIVHIWAKVFGYSHVSFRFLSIVCSFFTGVVLLKTGKKYFNFLTGVIAAVIFILSNIHIYYAEEARCYAMLGLLCSGSLYYLIGFIKNRDKKKLIGLTIINLMILYTHYIAGFLFLAEGVVVLLYFYNRFKLFGLYVLSQLVVLSGFLPWYFSASFKVEGFKDSWYPKLSFDLIYNFFMQTFNAENVLLLWLVLIGLGIIFIFIRKYRPKFKLMFALFVLSVLPLTIISLITQYYVRIFFARYEMFATIPMFLFLGYLIASFRIGMWFRLLVVLIFFYFSIPHVRVDAFRNIEWDKACIAGNAMMDDKTSVLLYPHFAVGCFDYYGLTWAYYNDFEQLNKNREKYNVFQVLDTNHIKSYQGRLYDRIMFYRTHYWENDNKDIENFLLKTHDQVYFREYWGVRIYIYVRKKPQSV